MEGEGEEERGKSGRVKAEQDMRSPTRPLYLYDPLQGQGYHTPVEEEKQKVGIIVLHLINL